MDDCDQHPDDHQLQTLPKGEGMLPIFSDDEFAQKALPSATPSLIVPSDSIAQQLCGMSFDVGLSLYAAAMHPTSINAALNWAVNNSKRTDCPIFFPASMCQRNEWANVAMGVGLSETTRLEALERVVTHACSVLSLQQLLKDSRIAVSASASRVVHALLQFKIRSIILDSVAPPAPAHPLMAKSLLEQALAPIEQAITRNVPAAISCLLLAQFRKLISSVHFSNGHGLGGSKCHYSGIPCWCRIDLKHRGSPPLVACIQVSAKEFPGMLQSEIMMPSDILQLQALIILKLCQGLAGKMLESADTALKRALPSQINDPLYDFDILDAVAADAVLSETFPNCKDFKSLEQEQKQQQRYMSSHQEEHRILHEKKMHDHLHQNRIQKEEEVKQKMLLSQQLQEHRQLMQKLLPQQVVSVEGQQGSVSNQNNLQILQPQPLQNQADEVTAASAHQERTIRTSSLSKHFTVLNDNQYNCNICGRTVRTPSYHLKKYHCDLIEKSQQCDAVPQISEILRVDVDPPIETKVDMDKLSEKLQPSLELLKPLECAAGEFCPSSKAGITGACPAGSFCPYADLGPSPTLAAVCAKRKQMEEVDQQLQDSRSKVARMISLVSQATFIVEKKRQKISVPPVNDDVSHSIFSAWDSFAALPLFTKFAHDCTERALIALLPSQQELQSLECVLPQGPRSEMSDRWIQQRGSSSFSAALLDFIKGERVWDPSSRVDFTGVDASIPETYRSFVTVSEGRRSKRIPICTSKFPFGLLNQSKTNVDKNRHCIRVKQKILCEINVSLLLQL
jgi:hypothetical protein